MNSDHNIDVGVLSLKFPLPHFPQGQNALYTTLSPDLMIQMEGGIFPSAYSEADFIFQPFLPLVDHLREQEPE